MTIVICNIGSYIVEDVSTIYMYGSVALSQKTNVRHTEFFRWSVFNYDEKKMW